MAAGGIVIGMDEAGYGPNLGPLVITATVWETPCTPARFNFWKRLAPVVRAEAGDNDRVFIADSKVVYQPAKGLQELERSVLSLLGLVEHQPATFRCLRTAVCGDAMPPPGGDAESHVEAPWYCSEDVEVPLTDCRDAVANGTSSLTAVMTKVGARLKAVACDIVTEARFNQQWEHAGGNKAAALTELSLSLLKRVWNPDSDVPTYVIADKHGGRNQYCGAISHVFDGRLPMIRDESRDRSRYSLGTTDLCFQARAEEHLPVAAASMVSKYVREVAMTAFNRFWRRHLPEVKATAGYPGDSTRFRRAIADTQQRLGIPDQLLWRCR